MNICMVSEFNGNYFGILKYVCFKLQVLFYYINAFYLLEAVLSIINVLLNASVILKKLLSC